jgi:Protein of unknown function (DUF3175)
VTETSHALALEPSVFRKRSPREIALSLKRSAERSRQRKTSPYGSAMSMLTFFINRAGKGLDPGRRRVLEQAKQEVRIVFGREPENRHGRPGRKASRRHGRSSGRRQTIARRR